MTMRHAIVAALVGAVAGQAAHAGQDPVTSVPLVFVPVIVFPSAEGLLSARPPAAANEGTAGAEAAAEAAAEATVDATADAGAAAEAAAAGATPDAARRITQVTELCRSLPDRAYAIDCVAAGLAEIAASLPRTGDQAAARAALSDAARNLRELAEANRNRDQPRVTVQRGDLASPRPLVPVVPSPALDAAAAAIVGQAQTVLLRSAPNATAANEYNRISAALDTTRVLLRSS